MFKLKIFLFKIKFFRIIFYSLFKFEERFKHYKGLNKDSIFIDIGSNIGNVSQYVHDKYRCNIICYEPNTICYNFLKKKFKKNDNIKVYNFAISNKEEKIKLYLHKEAKDENDIFYSEAGSLYDQKENISKSKFIMVDTIDIRKLINNFKKIDLIKIDIEGWEYNILNEIIENKDKIGKVICELHGNPMIKSKKNEIKNTNLTKNYNLMINKLKKKNLYGNWFIEWI